MEKQNTIAGEAHLSGIALHTGERANLTMKPAPENTGITFKRVDLEGSPEVKALASNVVDVRLSTTIAEGKASVQTVEHVLSALHGCKIDNAVIEMNGPEPPIADGSALPYVEMIKEAGIAQQEAPAKYWRPEQPVVIEQGETEMVLLPADNFKITCIVDFPGTPLGTQYFSSVISEELYSSGIAPARTICLYKELEQVLAMGLVKGGSLDNAVVIHDGAIISKDGLRFKDELVKHKVLDIIGDLYLTGTRMKAHILAIKPGHHINVQLAQGILKTIK